MNKMSQQLPRVRTETSTSRLNVGDMFRSKRSPNTRDKNRQRDSMVIDRQQKVISRYMIELERIMKEYRTKIKPKQILD